MVHAVYPCGCPRGGVIKHQSSLQMSHVKLHGGLIPNSPPSGASAVLLAPEMVLVVQQEGNLVTEPGSAYTHPAHLSALKSPTRCAPLLDPYLVGMFSVLRCHQWGPMLPS